jgi:hypothetical protein
MESTMEEWYAIAILDMSCGNESVGEMWQEAKTFTSDTRISDIMAWAAKKKRDSDSPESFRGNLKLTIGQ